MLSLRERNRLTAMHAIQDTALELFTSHGYSRTTIEQIATTSGVSPSTVYRYFDTKENLILWDEYDDVIASELLRRLPSEDPIDAIRAAFLTALSGTYDADDSRLLRRVKLMYAEPDVQAAAIGKGLADEAAIAEGLQTLARPPLDALTSRVVAGVCMAALNVAVGEWQRNDGQTPLANLVEEAFRAVENV